MGGLVGHDKMWEMDCGKWESLKVVWKTELVWLGFKNESVWRVLYIGKSKVRDDKLGIYYKGPEISQSWNAIINQGTDNAEGISKCLVRKKATGEEE